MAVAAILLLGGCGGGRLATSESNEEVREAADCCDYFEPFATVSIHDCASDSCRVKWCAGAETTTNQCGSVKGRALKVLATENDDTGPTVWVWWGDRGVKEVRIEFTYAQHQGGAPKPDTAGSYAEFKLVRGEDFDKQDCPRSGFSTLAHLSKTHTIPLDCFPEQRVIPVDAGDRALYLRFRKHKVERFTPLMRVDDLRITVVPID